MNKNDLLINPTQLDIKIEDCIYTIRGQQVMLDTDIASFFEVGVKHLNMQMKRNTERFPKDFCFKLNSKEFKNLRSQNVTFNHSTKGRKYPPYVFTEHGIMALAGVLKSDVAAKMSVEIVRKFVQMRKFIIENGDTLLALAKLQNRQLEFENETNRNFEKAFNFIKEYELPHTTLICDGKWFDAFSFITSLIEKANKSLILIDPYCDYKTFTYLSHIKAGIKITIYKGKYSSLKDEEIKLFEKEYGLITIKTSNIIHDRYLIIDEKECYSLGSSLNFVGKKISTILKVDDDKTIQYLIDRVNSLEPESD